MEQTSASIARRTEHDKKALVAEWESKLSLLNAERTSEKRDLNLTMERQQVRNIFYLVLKNIYYIIVCALYTSIVIYCENSFSWFVPLFMSFVEL